MNSETVTREFGDVSAAAISRDAKYVIILRTDQKVQLWEIAPGKLAQSFDDTVIAAVTLNTQYLLMAKSGGAVQLCDPVTGRLLHKLEVGPEPIAGLNFSQNSEYALVALKNNMIQVWEAATGRRLRQYGDDADYLETLSADAKRALTKSDLTTWHLEEFGTNKEIRRFEDVESVQISPDSRLVVTRGKGVVRLWNAETGKEMRMFGKAPSKLAPGTEITSVSVTPDWRYMVTGDNQTVRLWDLQSGTEERQLIGHTGLVTSVAISEDGKTILSAGQDGSARLWESETGKSLRRFDADPTATAAVAAGRQGKYVATLDP